MAGSSWSHGKDPVVNQTCHPIFLRFVPWEGEADGLHHYDFLGVKTDPKFWKNIKPQPKGILRTGYPTPHEQYFEWVFMLETVLECKDQSSFCVVELGAGYAPWAVRSFMAYRRFSNAPVRLVAVEGDYNHYQWVLEHFRNNRLDPDEHDIYHACVSFKPGTVAFHQSDDPKGDYGQRIYADLGEFDASERGQIVERAGKKMQKLAAVTIDEITERIDRVDLIHMDVQGAEYNIVKSCMDTLNAKVARVIVGAHSEEIEQGLRKLFNNAHWQNRYDFDRRSHVDTEWGPIDFRDGCQAWENPRLVG